MVVGGGGRGVKNRPVARGVCKKVLFRPQNGPKMIYFSRVRPRALGG